MASGIYNIDTAQLDQTDPPHINEAEGDRVIEVPTAIVRPSRSSTAAGPPPQTEGNIPNQEPELHLVQIPTNSLRATSRGTARQWENIPLPPPGVNLMTSTSAASTELEGTTLHITDVRTDLDLWQNLPDTETVDTTELLFMVDRESNRLTVIAPGDGST